MNERVEKAGKEWMVLLVGLSEESTGGTIEAVKKFLEFGPLDKISTLLHR